MISTQINKAGYKNNNRKFKPTIREEIAPEPLAALNELTSQVRIPRRCVNVIDEQVIFEQFWGIWTLLEDSGGRKFQNYKTRT